MDETQSGQAALVAMTALVLGLAGCGGGGSSDRLNPPYGVTARSDAPGEVTLDWSLISGASSYNIYWLTSPGVTKGSGTQIPGVMPPYTQTGLANGTTYYYVVTSTAGARESDESSEVSATPMFEGVPDPGFGGGGFVFHDGAGGGSSHDYGYAIAVDSSDRVVVAGSSNQAVAANPDMAIWRFNDDGSLDTTFNGQGWVTYHDAAGGNGVDNGFAMTLDPSGRIVVGGASWNASGNYDMVAWRYEATGVIDTAFGPGGLVVYDGLTPPNSSDAAYGVTLDASGRILLAGGTSGPAGNGDATIWRYNDDGSADVTFNGQGWVTHDGAAGGNGSDTGFDVAADAAGRILIAGQSQSASGGYDVVVWRLDANGSPDTTFNGQGWVTEDTAVGANDWGRGIALDASGGILVAGSSRQGMGLDDMAIWRFTSAGVLDTTFGSAGVVLHDGAGGAPGEERGHGMTLDAAGRILVTGYGTTTAGDKDMVIWRCLPDGSLDADFGGQGWVAQDGAAGGADDDEGRAITIDGSDRILVVGTSRNAAGDFDMVIWRFR